MGAERHLRRKFTFRTSGRQVVFVKQKQERTEHVLMKAFLWALYLPDYPALQVEVAIGEKYKPDVVALGYWGEPRFWGEAGAVGLEKMKALVRRYPRTHLAIGKWDTALQPFIEIITQAASEVSRDAPFDLIRFPADSYSRFIDNKGNISVPRRHLDWRRL